MSHLPEPIIPVVKFGIEQYVRGEAYKEFRDEPRTYSRQTSITSVVDFRNLLKDDIPSMVSDFAEIGWNKLDSLYEKYFEEQENNQRYV